MSKALYTKYRPNTFDEVIGQDIAVQILQRSIDLNKINHAYLFYGVRGTGKTTLARIFAKTINCSSPISNNPCNECESCKAFNNGSAFDMIEIDAASHNGVDEIRDLTEKANYSTTSSKYKVYIIDEVHMLSKSAFNALLKTLEEPPKNTIFLLATTEINKIPDTILSRTIVLNLQLVSADKIKEQLIRILNNENIDYEAEALDYIAKLADGSVRDAISFLETALLYSNSLTKENVIKVLGVLDTETIKNILLNNSIESIELINETINGFRLSLLFIDELISLIKTGKNEYKSLLDKITDGILSIKDPILLNRYLRSIFIQGVNISNVSRETINEQKEDTKETNVVENVSRETILDKKEETVKEIEENVDISAEETIEEPIENTEKTKEIVIEEKETDHIFNYITPKDIVNEMLLNDELQLSSLNNKWEILEEYSERIEDKTILNYLNKSKPLVITDKMLILGLEDQWIYEEIKKLTLSCNMLDFIKHLTNREIAIIPVVEEQWTKMLALAKQIKEQGANTASEFDLDEIFNCNKEQTRDIALDLFGDKLIEND